MELISIIVPVYNAAPYLDRCIKSIIDQTYQNIELLLIDDGSTDLSLTICESWATRDKRIRVIHKSNGGVSSARNIGLDNALGEYVFFCDADDAIINMCLDLLIQCQKQFNSSITVGRLEPLFSQDEELSHLCVNADQSISYSLTPRDFFKMIREKRVITGKLIKREQVNRIRFDTKLSIGEDTVFLYKMLQQENIMLSYCPSALYICYRDHVSATTGKKVLPGFYSVGEWCIENWKNSRTEVKEYILMEGIKNLLIYRYRHRKNRNYPKKKEVNCILNKGLSDLIREQRFSLKKKIVYSVMTYIPSLYSLYTWWRNR